MVFSSLVYKQLINGGWKPHVLLRHGVAQRPPLTVLAVNEITPSEKRNLHRQNQQQSHPRRGKCLPRSG